MPLARQPDGLPTNKSAVASTVASVVTSGITIAAFTADGQLLPPEITEAYGVFIYGIVALVVSLVATIMPRVGVAWWVPDRPNQIPRED